MKAIINTEVTVNKVGIIKTPNLPSVQYWRLATAAGASGNGKGTGLLLRRHSFIPCHGLQAHFVMQRARAAGSVRPESSVAPIFRGIHDPVYFASCHLYRTGGHFRGCYKK
jgi:hypothetical protein